MPCSERGTLNLEGGIYLQDLISLDQVPKSNHKSILDLKDYGDKQKMSSDLTAIQLNNIEAGEKGANYKSVPHTENGAIITNPTYDYFEKEEKLNGFLSKQFPTIANPAPLGLCGFALTTFVLSLYNAGGLVCK